MRICIYMYIYNIYTCTLYPLVSAEFPSKGKGTGGGPPFARHFKNLHFCWISPYFFLPHQKLTSHLFPSCSPCSFMVADNTGKKVPQIAFWQFCQNISPAVCIFRGTVMTYLKKLAGKPYFNKKQWPIASKISHSVCYHIDHISLLYLPKIMSPLVSPLSNMSPI